MAHTHEELDLRSLALHRQIVVRLREQPSLLQIACDNLERWDRRQDPDDLASAAIEEWKNILKTLSIEDICELLVRQDEDANRLRQNTPFAGILSPSEVWSIKRNFRSEKTPA